jgi:NADH-quinone oxidoreductase subunit N
MLSLFGLPLTAGFTGKILVFRPALDAGFYLLVITAVINTAISAYYYLRLIVVMFFRERTTDWALPRIPASMAVVLILAVIGVLGFGIFSNGAIRAFQRNPAAAVIQAEK